MTNKKAIKEFDRLGNLIKKYAHRWDGNASIRMQGWVDSYTELRETHRPAFNQYCEERGFCNHEAYDLLA